MNRPNFYHFLPARNTLQLLRSSHCQNFQTIIFTGQRLEKYVNCQKVFLLFDAKNLVLTLFINYGILLFCFESRLQFIQTNVLRIFMQKSV